MIARLTFALLSVLPAQETASTTQPATPASPEPTHAREAWVDVDGDGHQDLVLTLSRGGVRVLRNAGEAGFEDVTDLVGHEVLAHARQATWADIEGDGDLDLVAVQFDGAVALLRNEGGAVFARADAGSGLETITGALSASWNDFDADGAPDLLLRTVEGYVLEHNSGLGVFEPLLSEAAPAPTPLMGTSGSERETGEPGRNGPRAASVGIDSRDVGDAGARVVTGPAGPPTPKDGGETGMIGGPGSGTVSTVATTPVSGTIGPAEKLLTCLPWIHDASTGACVGVDSTPTLGQLYPLGPELFIDSASGFVGMGTLSPNYALEVAGQVVSGTGNTASGLESAVGGGKLNVASGEQATVAGGEANTAPGNDAAIGGGLSNLATGGYSSIPGGRQNVAAGAYSLATGHRAQALHDGAMVWGDSTSTDILSTGPDQFVVQAAGGVGIGRAPGLGMRLDVDGIVRSSDTIVSTKPSGAPFLVTSSTLNTNLNADLLDGFHASAFSMFGPEIESNEIADGTIMNFDVAAGAGIVGTKINPYFGQQDISMVGGTRKLLFSEDGVNGAASLFYDGAGVSGGENHVHVRNELSDVNLTTWELGGNVGMGTDDPDVRLHLEGGTDVGPIGGGYLQCGPSSGRNVAIDGDEIMARDMGFVASLTMNADGGNVYLFPDGSGQLGVGTSSPEPGAVLDVDGDARFRTEIAVVDGPDELVVTADKLLYQGAAELRFESEKDLRLHSDSDTTIESDQVMTIDSRDDMTLGSDGSVTVMATKALSLGSGQSDDASLVAGREASLTGGTIVDIDGFTRVDISGGPGGVNISSSPGGVNLSSSTGGVTIAGTTNIWGGLYVDGFWVTSDRRWKREIEPVTNVLDELMTLHGRTYLWREDAPVRGDEGLQYGFIAQEVLEVFPELVKEHPDGEHYTVAYHKVVPLLVEGLRELRSERDAEITALRGELEALKELVRAQQAADPDHPE